MVRWCAGAPRFEMGGLQLEIPASLAVGVVDQHHAIAVLEAERLFLDNFSILANEPRAKHMDDERNDWKPRKNVPRGGEVEAAEIAPHGGDGCAARKPIAARPNLLEALVGQHEIDGRRCGFARSEPQDFVRRAVGRRRVRSHADAVRDWFELRCLLSNAATWPI